MAHSPLLSSAPSSQLPASISSTPSPNGTKSDKVATWATTFFSRVFKSYLPLAITSAVVIGGLIKGDKRVMTVASLFLLPLLYFKLKASPSHSAAQAPSSPLSTDSAASSTNPATDSGTTEHAIQDRGGQEPAVPRAPDAAAPLPSHVDRRFSSHNAAASAAFENKDGAFAPIGSSTRALSPLSIAQPAHEAQNQNLEETAAFATPLSSPARTPSPVLGATQPVHKAEDGSPEEATPAAAAPVADESVAPALARTPSPAPDTVATSLDNDVAETVVPTAAVAALSPARAAIEAPQDEKDPSQASVREKIEAANRKSNQERTPPKGRSGRGRRRRG